MAVSRRMAWWSQETGPEEGSSAVKGLAAAAASLPSMDAEDEEEKSDSEAVLGAVRSGAPIQSSRWWMESAWWLWLWYSVGPLMLLLLGKESLMLLLLVGLEELSSLDQQRGFPEDTEGWVAAELLTAAEVQGRGGRPAKLLLRGAAVLCLAGVSCS